MASSCTRGSLVWGLIKISSPTGVSGPEGISKPGLGTGFSGGLGSAGGMVGFLKVFSNLGDSVSPSPAACASSPSPEGDFKQQRGREGSQGCQRSFPTTEHSKPNRDLFLAQRTAEQHPKHSKPNPDLPAETPTPPNSILIYSLLWELQSKPCPGHSPSHSSSRVTETMVTQNKKAKQHQISVWSWN